MEVITSRLLLEKGNQNDLGTIKTEKGIKMNVKYVRKA